MQAALLPTAVLMASLISGGIQDALSSSNRMSTLVDTLLTFWPPAPLDLANENSTSSAIQPLSQKLIHEAIGCIPRPEAGGHVPLVMARRL